MTPGDQVRYNAHDGPKRCSPSKCFPASAPWQSGRLPCRAASHPATGHYKICHLAMSLEIQSRDLSKRRAESPRHASGHPGTLLHRSGHPTTTSCPLVPWCCESIDLHKSKHRRKCSRLSSHGHHSKCTLLLHAYHCYPWHCQLPVAPAKCRIRPRSDTALTK